MSWFKSARPRLPQQEEAKPAAQAAEQAAELDPQPYRLVLKLPAVDPSAPAEAVTKALRAAGLPFEVETIERMQPGEWP